MKSNLSLKGVVMILILLSVIFYLISKMPDIYDPAFIEKLADPGNF